MPISRLAEAPQKCRINGDEDDLHAQNIVGRAGGLAVATTVGMPLVRAQGKPRVVVIGGGPGGATAAKYIAKDSQGAIEVVLVEPKESFVTCFHSNLYLGASSLLMQSPIAMTSWSRPMASGMCGNGPTQSTATNARSFWATDRGLAMTGWFVSPGIDLRYDSVPGWGKEHEETMPHAWLAARKPSFCASNWTM